MRIRNTGYDMDSTSKKPFFPSSESMTILFQYFRLKESCPLDEKIVIKQKKFNLKNLCNLSSDLELDPDPTEKPDRDMLIFPLGQRSP
jgi:hypothetical protein